MKVSEYILHYLKEKGITHAFLVTGGAIANVVHAFDTEKNLTYVCNTHEQASAMSAEGYARVSKKFGVALATSGPGATNLITGIGCAYFDSIPTLYITGQVNLDESTWEGGPRQVGFQETDIVSMIKPITKFAVKVDMVQDIKLYLDKALYIAQSGRPGPVLLDIPMNIQRAEVDPATLRSFLPEPTVVDENLLMKKVHEMIGLIHKAQRPVVVLGAGVKLGHAEEQTREFIESLGIPVVLSWGAIDVVEHANPLYVGTLGVSADRPGNFTVQNADLIISLGSRLDTRQTGGKPGTFGRVAKKVVVDIDPSELHKGRGLKVDVAINFDIKDFLVATKNALHTLRSPDVSPWKARIHQWRKLYPICKKQYFDQKEYVNPYVFMDTLSDECSEGDIIIADTGSNLTWTMQAFKIKKSQQLFSALGNSPMGYSLPAAIGAAFAEPKKQVICITGDGGIKMNISELETVLRYNLPLKIFVINNHGFGIIKQFQDVWLESSYKATGVEGGLGDPDFVQIAEAYGMEAIHLREHSELRTKIQQVLAAKASILCSVDVHPDEKIIPKLEFGKPIEDSAPLLDRGELRENMIIPPLL